MNIAIHQKTIFNANCIWRDRNTYCYIGVVCGYQEVSSTCRNVENDLQGQEYQSFQEAHKRPGDNSDYCEKQDDLNRMDDRKRQARPSDSRQSGYVVQQRSQ